MTLRSKKISDDCMFNDYFNTHFDKKCKDIYKELTMRNLNTQHANLESAFNDEIISFKHGRPVNF